MQVVRELGLIGCLLVPAGYRADKQWPLVIALHGYGGDGSFTLTYLRLDDVAPNAVLVAPNGVVDSRGSRAWHAGAVAVWGRNEQCTGPIAATPRTIDLDSHIAGAETIVEAYSGCQAGSAVELWTMQGVGHNPGATADFAPSLFGFLTSHPR